MPRISEDIIQPRLVDFDLRHPQMVEQLVEVPTILSFAALEQQIAEQIADIPVPLGRGGSSRGGLQGFHPKQVSQRTVEQLDDTPVPGGSLHVPHPDPGRAASSAVSRDEAFQGVFRTVPRSKKMRSLLGDRVRGCTGTRAHPS